MQKVIITAMLRILLLTPKVYFGIIGINPIDIINLSGIHINSLDP